MADYKATLDDSEWRIFLASVTGNLKDIPHILSSAYGTHGWQDIMAHFKNESDEHGKWKAWSPAYARLMERTTKKTSKGKIEKLKKIGASLAGLGEKKILQRSGDMRDSILIANIRTISSTGIEVYANSEYSGVHDRGGKNMPKRSFMWLSDRAKDLMMQFIANFVWR